MLEGLYSAAAGMAAQQTRLDDVSNDIANVSTTGYKQTRTAFRDLLYFTPAQGAAAGVQTGAGAAAAYAGRSLQQGAIQDTGNPLDVALTGPGFLEVKKADGTLALTRAGNLSLDSNGRLTTQTGELLQPPVTIPAGTTPDQIEIGSDGTVSAKGTRVGQLAIVNVASPDQLQSAGDSLYVPTAGSGAPAAASGTRLQQGQLEASNVDLGESMVEMIDAQRSYELASKAIQMQDQMMQIANEVKR